MFTLCSIGPWIRNIHEEVGVFAEFRMYVGLRERSGVIRISRKNIIGDKIL
jgi:hypothetical protein